MIVPSAAPRMIRHGTVSRKSAAAVVICGCGNLLPVAEQSYFDTRGRIDHIWSCDDCGYEFWLVDERDLAIG
jgi:hypothetical protein